MTLDAYQHNHHDTNNHVINIPSQSTIATWFWPNYGMRFHKLHSTSLRILLCCVMTSAFLEQFHFPYTFWMPLTLNCAFFPNSAPRWNFPALKWNLRFDQFMWTTFCQCCQTVHFLPACVDRCTIPLHAFSYTAVAYNRPFIHLAMQ